MMWPCREMQRAAREELQCLPWMPRAKIPMLYADMVGLDKVYEAVCRYHNQFGDIWKPAPLLKRLAKQGKTFNDI